MSNIICYNSNNEELTSLYQWDSNQTIRISGVSYIDTPMLHFCNKQSKTALVVTPDISDGNLIAAIPNVLLQVPDTILVYLFADGDDNGSRTVTCVTRIPVIPRPRPSDYEFSEDIDPYGVKNQLGGMSFVICTKEEFDALNPKSDTTEYFVKDGNGAVKVYLGANEISGAEGGGSGQQSVANAAYITDSTVVGSLAIATTD